MKINLGRKINFEAFPLLEGVGEEKENTVISENKKHI